MTVFELTFTDNEVGEEFKIGCFSSREKAEQTAQYYLKNVEGFCEYDCSYTIAEKPVTGGTKPSSVIWYVWGSCDDDSDDESFVVSDYYSTEALARRRLAEMKSEYPFDVWDVCRCEIDKCEWTDGFFRAYY